MAASTVLPAGVITCVFTDIEGSTRLLRELGDEAYGELLARHHETLRGVWRAHGGAEVGTEGDGFFVVFAEAGDAVAAAAAAQRALGAVRWPTPLPVRVRIGVHRGFAQPQDGDYTALVVHQAARVVDAAHGGQVLVSEEAAAGVPGDGEERLVSLGHFRVRDFPRPVELFRVEAPGLTAPGAAPRVRPADGHNLVAPLTPLLGREFDLVVVGDGLGPGTLTTLVGPGGVGKTRLAVELGLQAAGRRPDGAWFVDLAPLVAPEAVPEAIGDAVGAPSAPGAERWSLVLDHLAGRDVLVVLDNAEHLLAAAAHGAAELLARCPGVALLVTSRVPLGLRAERVHRVRPLDAGSADAPAVALFRARAAGSPADPELVAELCDELDGLPLAIELAAARSAAVSPAELLERLRRSPGILRSRDPTLPERQRSLERLLDWSYDLLEPDARAVLGRLTAFAGDFALEAAEEVGAGGGLDPADVAELVWTLVDCSLVGVEHGAGASRYRLLSTVRAYARGRIDPAERSAAVRRLGRRYLRRLGPERALSRAWLSEMDAELDNVRGVVAASDDPALAQALAWSIGRHHDATDAFRTGIIEVGRWAGRRPERTPERVALLTLLADLHLRVAELEQAAALLAEASALAAETGAPAWDPAGIERTAGELRLRRGDVAGAAEIARRALAATADPRAHARLHNLLGIALDALGDHRGGAAAFAAELEAARGLGLDTLLPTVYANLAESHLRLGEHAVAARHQERSLTLAREQRQPVLVAFSLMIAARLIAERGDHRRAVGLQSAADRLLAGASYALYDHDRDIRDALMDEARGALGEAAYGAAREAGARLDANAAADLAAEVLQTVGSRPHDQEVTV